MNYKIEVKSKEEACVAGYLAQTLGYKMDTMFSEKWSDRYCYLLLCSDMSAGFGNESMTNGDEPMSMTELRALASLHKNPINMDKVLNDVRSDALGLLKDKEYLRRNAGGTYSYVGTVHPDHVHDLLIKIPDGADIATSLKFVIGAVSFLKRIDDSFLLWSEQVGEWGSKKYKTITRAVGDNKVLWQRHAQPEELPFVDDESINDQYAEIEQVRRSHCEASETADPTIKETLSQRQSQYGSFEDVATATQDLLKILEKTGLKSLPSMHKEALHMICSKMVRIVNGDHNFIESWHDIAGYATLMENELRVTDGATNSRLTYQKVINGKLQDI